MRFIFKIDTIELLQKKFNSRNIAVLFMVFMASSYIYSCLYVVARKCFWMDEVLAVSTAKLESIQQILNAIWNGAEYSPPVYHVFLHYALNLLNGVPLLIAARIPSILSVLIAAVAIYVLMRRRVSRSIACCSFGLTLSLGFYGFAIQAREYALLSMAFSFALLCWDAVDKCRRPILSAIGLWLSLSLCLVVHFYGVICVCAIVVCELVWLYANKKLRPVVIVPLLCLIPVFATLVPLGWHLAKFNAQDVASPYFAARPSIRRLLSAVNEIVVGAKVGIIFAIAAMISIYLAHATSSKSTEKNTATSSFWNRQSPDHDHSIKAMMIGLLSIVVVTFLLSVLVTRTFQIRYTIGAAFFYPIAFGFLLSRLRGGQLVSVIVLPVLLALPLYQMRSVGYPYQDVWPKVQAMALDRTLPIVVDDGNLYLQLQYAADPNIKSRLYYVLTPKEWETDPVNEHQVQRMAVIRKDIKVVDLHTFIAQHPRFYIVSRLITECDSIVPPLMAQGALGPMLAHMNETFLLRAGADEGT